MNKIVKLFKNTLIFGIGNIGSKLIQFIAVPMFTMYLTTGEYGEADLLTVIVSLALPFFSFCLYDAILRFIIDERKYEKSIVSSSIFVIGIIIIFLFLIIVILSFMDFKNVDLYIVTVIFLIAQMIQSLLAQYVKAVDKNWEYAMNGLLLSFFILILSFVLFHVLSNRLFAYFFAQIFAYLISSAFLLFCLRDRVIFEFKSVKKIWIKKLMSYSLPLIPNQIMWWMMNTSDRLLVTMFLGLSTNGLYAVAAKIPSLTNVIVTIFMQAWQISSFENAKDSNKDSFFSAVFNNLIYCLVIFSSLVISFLMFIMTILAAKEYFTAWKYVPLLLIGGLFSNISMFLGINYLVGKNTIGIFRTSVIGAILNVLLNLVLIPKMGANGASVSTFVSYFVVCAIRFFETRKMVKINLDFKLMISSVLVLTIQIVLLYLGFIKFQIILPLIFFLINFKYIKNAYGMLDNFIKTSKK